jgi:CheY-like chemotaxis protein
MKKPRIIVIENDSDEIFFMEEAFNKTALFDVLAMVTNGDQLFEWLAGHKGTLPDLILSDLNMEGKNGYDVIAEIKSNPEYNPIRVVITSTSSVASVRDKCMKLGASDYMVKPETFNNYEPFVKELYRRSGS